MTKRNSDKSDGMKWENNNNKTKKKKHENNDMKTFWPSIDV